jgi:hypothetical protein
MNEDLYEVNYSNQPDKTRLNFSSIKKDDDTFKPYG